MIELIVSSRAESDLVEAFDSYEKSVVGLGSEFIRSVDADVVRVARRW